jgi:hypothetical protein
MGSRAMTAMTRAAEATGHVVRVESVEPYGWIVYVDGRTETHFFHSRLFALNFASRWAAANRPSVVLLAGGGGRIERHAEYPETDASAAA